MGSLIIIYFFTASVLLLMYLYEWFNINNAAVVLPAVWVSYRGVPCKAANAVDDVEWFINLVHVGACNVT